MTRNLFAAVLLSGTMCLFAGCEVEKTEPGRTPKVDVDVDPGKVPKYDVDAPSVKVNTEERTVTVPDVDIDVNKKDTAIKVPDVDIVPADKDTNDK